MKLGIVFISFFVVTLVFAGLVGASGSCSSDQIIMRFNSNTNTHAGIWNSSGAVKICYSDLFSIPYEGSNPHECTSENAVIKLSSESNAHASNKNSADYPVSVCYNGLSSCTIESSGSCPSNKALVAYISNSDNAHLQASWTPPTGSADYSAVCCRGESEPKTPTVGVSACYELTDKISCDNENGSIAVSDPGCFGNSCECSWDDFTGKCNLQWDIKNSTDSGCDYKCVVTTSDQTECSGGSKIISMVANPVLVSAMNCAQIPALETGCISRSATVACGNVDENLPFFGGWQLFISAISLVIIYTIFFGNRRA